MVRRFILRLLGVASREDILALQRAIETRAAKDAEVAALRAARLRDRVKGLQRSFRELDDTLRKGRLSKIDQNVDALVRHAFLPVDALTPAQQLIARRFRGLSQNEEDGITLALFARVGTATSRFVEIGAGSNGGNSGFLARECGWTGLMFESDHGRAAMLRERFGPAVTVIEARVTRENVNDLVAQHGAGGDIDLLSIDIDGNDYWVWDSLTACRPRIVIAEYNPSFGASRAVTIPYDAGFRRRAADGREGSYYGASLQALAGLGARKGYRLVMTEPRGVNAFFVREDLARDLLAIDPSQVPLGAQGDAPPDPEALFAHHAQAGRPLVEVS